MHIKGALKYYVYVDMIYSVVWILNPPFLVYVKSCVDDKYENPFTIVSI